jgi:hypothetical protein
MSISPRNAFVRHAAGACLFRWREDNSPMPFRQRLFAACCRWEYQYRKEAFVSLFFSKSVFAIRPLLFISAAHQPSRFTG